MNATFPLHKRRRRRLARMVLLSMLTLSALGSLSGCTRRFFRWRADAEVDQILAQKDKFPQWKLDDYYIWPHPLSRFADPTDWDRPPMPPDDPAAWDLAPHPQRPVLRGHRYWEGTGYIDLMRKWDVENRARKDAERAAKQDQAAQTLSDEPLLPGESKTSVQRAQEIDDQIERDLNAPTSATQALPQAQAAGLSTTCRPFLLNLEQITQLGFLNSREFQTIREGLYLTALPVTAERFAFIAQPFVTEQVIRERSGARTVDGQTNRWLANTTAGFTKLFSTGALLLFNFANQTIYNLGAGPLHTISQSTISLDFIQPFLAGGGRAVALEPLTQAERNLLYAIRDFFRFRQEYFVFFAAGQSTGFIPGVGAGVVALAPSTVGSPGVFVPISGTLPTTLANPATVQAAPGSGGLLRPIFGPAPTPQGYLSTIAERGVLSNYYKNIQALQRFMVLFEAYLEGGIVNQVQKGQVEQQLLRSIETVLGNHSAYRTSLDQLKQQLGLPLTVNLDLDDGPLRPMIQLTEEYEILSVDYERVGYAIGQFGRTQEARLLRQRIHQLFDTTPLLRGTQTRERIRERWRYWENLGKDLPTVQRNALLVRRIDELARKSAAMSRQQRTQEGGTTPEAEKELTDLFYELDMARFEYNLSIYEQEPWKALKTEVEQLRDANSQVRRVLRSVNALADGAVIERQQRLKDRWPPLPALCADGVDLLSAPEAEAMTAIARTALTNRVDMMNVRAELVDSWRKIRVAANALMGTFNVDYHLDSTTPTGRGLPFSFGDSRTRHELIFTGTLPLVRILQRNNYRSTLINFQQNRRNLMLYEDQILFEVRLEMRQMRVLSNNYHRVQKRAIELAYFQVDQALQAFSQPQAPPGQDMPGTIGPTSQRPQAGDPAALTNQLLTTQNSLLGAQNDLYNTWINYLTNRMYLYRDLGVMRFDHRGVWIDDNSACPPSAPTGQQQQQPAGGKQPEERPEQLPAPRPEQLPPPRPEPAAQGAGVEPKR